MVMLELPVLLTVADSDRLLPSVTLPKLRVLGFDPNAPNASPVPDKGNVRVGSEASDVIVTVPLALPLARGAKATVRVVL